MTTGFVYALRNAAMPGIFKIGHTHKHPDLRARELSSTSSPFEFNVVCYAPCLSARQTERLLRRQLDHARVNPKREFFRLSVKDLDSAFSRFGVELVDVEITPMLFLEERGLPWWATGEDECTI